MLLCSLKLSTDKYFLTVSDSDSTPQDMLFISTALNHSYTIQNILLAIIFGFQVICSETDDVSVICQYLLKYKVIFFYILLILDQCIKML